MLKLLSAPPKSQLISEFFEFPTDVSQNNKSAVLFNKHS